jgi:hemolysin activation/secretion protein
LVWSYTQSNSEVGAGIGGVTVLGKGRIWGLRRTVSLLLQEREYHLLTLGADYKDFDETISAADNQGETTPIKYLPLNASYLGSGGNATGRWQWGASLSVGLQGLVNQTAQFRSKRDAAKASYSLIKLDLTREQPLPFWGSSLRARVDAQWTADALVSNEQFVAGGVDSVRGYLESAVAGDSGLRASLEWRSRNWGPSLDGLGMGRWLSNLSGLAFAEGAAAFVRSPGAGQNSRFGLLGAGVGLRLKAKPGVTGALDLGWALHDQGATRRGDLRLHASGLFEF